MTSIVRNHWYVAAYGREIGRELFSRTICGESILFWRTEAGEVTAMSDRCVHRGHGRGGGRRRPSGPAGVEPDFRVTEVRCRSGGDGGHPRRTSSEEERDG